MNSSHVPPTGRGQEPRDHWVVANWKAHACGGKPLEGREIPLLSDARVWAQAPVAFGPYRFYSTVGGGGTSSCVATLFVKIEEFISEDDWVDMSRTNTDLYHGGTDDWELAALVSLLLGARFIPGEPTRVWGRMHPPEGRPQWSEARIEPALPGESHSLMIPQLRGVRRMEELRPLASLVQLPRAAALALVKAARLYQTAVWVSDHEPEWCWLHLVSAVECVAAEWDSGPSDPVELLRDWRPDIHSELRNRGDAALTKRIAKKLSRLAGSTSRFVRFLSGHAPPPPRLRPGPHRQVDWGPESLEQAFRKTYEWRSAALHGTAPIPGPLCLRPIELEDGFEERPTGLAHGFAGGVWVEADLPIALHVFAYIVRHSIIRWWRSVAGPHFVEADCPQLDAGAPGADARGTEPPPAPPPAGTI